MVTLTPSILSTAATATANCKERIRVMSGSPRTDGEKVWLPGIKSDLSPAEALILRGYFDHEVAHLRYRSFHPFQPGRPDPHVHSMYNAIEDVRIEAKSCHELPGTVGPLAAIREACLNADRSGQQLSSFEQAAHAVCWYGQGIGSDRVPYCAEGWAILDRIDLSRYDEWLTSPHTRSAKSALNLAEVLTKLVLDAIDQLNEEGADKPEPGDDGDSQPDDDSGDGDGQPGDDSGDSQPGDSQPGDGQGWSSDCNSDPMDSSVADGIDQIRDSRNDNKMRDENGCDWAYLISEAGREMDTRERAIGLSFSDVHRDAMRIAQTLREQLIARDRVHWTLPRESGHRIDRRTLPGVASGQTVSAFNRRRVDRAIHTKVTILLDESSSMSSVYDTAVRAAWTIADATESLGCPSEIIGFSSGDTELKRPGRVTSATPLRGGCGGGTQMLTSLIRERSHAEAYPRHRRVVFIITDGRTHAERQCVDHIRQQRADGVTFIALCVNCPPHAVARACDHVVQCSADDLAATMHAGLQSL